MGSSIIPEGVSLETLRLAHDSLMQEYYASCELQMAAEDRRPLPTTFVVVERARDFAKFIQEMA